MLAETPTIPILSLRPAQAARALGISARALWSLTAAGEIPHVRLSRKMLVYPVHELREWLSQKTKKAAGSEPATTTNG